MESLCMSYQIVHLSTILLRILILPSFIHYSNKILSIWENNFVYVLFHYLKEMSD